MSDEDFYSGEGNSSSDSQTQCFLPLKVKSDNSQPLKLQSLYAKIISDNIEKLTLNELKLINTSFVSTKDIITLWHHVINSQIDNKDDLIARYLAIFYDRFDSIMLDEDLVKTMHYDMIINILDDNYLDTAELERFVAKWSKLTDSSQEIIIKNNNTFYVLVPIIICISVCVCYLVKR
uniref:BACK domain-containing protein n=1 Tax=viral metagenome TaxID=1070528 RepID=A0A6C0CBR8_9ZZZZ